MDDRPFAGTLEICISLYTPILHDEVHPCSKPGNSWHHLTDCLICLDPTARASTLQVTVLYLQ